MIICDDCSQVTYKPSFYVLGAIRCPDCSKVFNANNHEVSAEDISSYLGAIITYEEKDESEWVATDIKVSGRTEEEG